MTKVLITAGGTVAPIDDVRVISNRSTGRFGARLAEAWLSRGAAVTYLATTPQTIGPLEVPTQRFAHSPDPAEVRQRFLGGLSQAWNSADRLRRIDLELGTVADYSATLQRLAESQRWDVVMLAAAVSDYEPAPVEGKIPSDAEEIVLKLRRTPKVIRSVRDWVGEHAFLVGFKLTSGADDDALVRIAREACRTNRADATIANDQSSLAAGRHRVAVVEASGAFEWFEPGDDLAKRVVDRLTRRTRTT
jgi:phosphopantothenate-cysteine ligase